MSGYKLIEIPTAAIEVSERIRALDPDWVKGLAVLIKEDGLKCPLEVYQAEGSETFQLVAGYHRLEALKLLGHKKVPCRRLEVESGLEAAEVRIAEISENLFRQELDALSRAGHLAELKGAYEAKYPHLGHGGDRKSGERQLPDFEGKDQVAIIATWSGTRFTSEVAEKIGLSERSVRMAVKIWHDIAPKVRTMLAGTEHAKKQSDLLTLAELLPPQQGQAIDLLFAEPPKADNLKDAIEQVLDAKVVKGDPVQKVSALFGRLDKRRRFSFYGLFKDEIQEFAKKEGWIQ